MKKIIRILPLIILNSIAIAVIIYFFLPVARWYYNYSPLFGVDFFYTVSFVTFLKDNFTFPYSSWFSLWFGGWPFFYNSPILQYYFILPLTYFFDVISAVKIWVMISTTIFLVGIYALTVRLSKLIGLGIIITLSAAFSVGVYGALTWGGSLPSFATQAFYPWVIYFILLYLDGRKRKFLYIAGLLTGLSTLSHPIIPIGYIYPTVGILILGYSSKSYPFFSKRKIADLIIFTSLSILVSLPLLFYSFGPGFKSIFVKNVDSSISTVRVPEEINQDVLEFIHQQPHRIYIDNHPVLFTLLELAAVLFLIRLVFLPERISSLKKVLPFLLISIYFVVYIWIFAYGISIYHGGWYRLFWSVSVWTGVLISVLLGQSLTFFITRFIKPAVLNFTVLLVISIILVIGIFPLWSKYNTNFFDRLLERSETSSAYPGVINLRFVGKEELIPSWMPPDDFQYRYYSPSATVNIWFNSMFKRPLVRGYFDPPITSDERSYLFLTDASLSKDETQFQLTSSFEFPEDLAYNNALFFIDWNAIKFIGVSPTDSEYSVPHDRIISKENIKNDATIEFLEVYKKRNKEWLQYMEFNDDLVSPVIQVTSVPVVGVFASDSGFEVIMRNLAHMNLNSQDIIPLKMGKSLDRVSSEQLKSLNALILYEYDYQNKGKVDRLLNDYLRAGGKIFVDTGSEGKDTANNSPLDVLPINNSIYEPISEDWVYKIGDSQLTKGVNFKSFSPLIFDANPWNISYTDNDLKEGSKAILTSGKNIVMADRELGSGKIIWSGLNFPYHIIRNNNLEEIELFEKIITSLIPKSNSAGTSDSITRDSSEKIIIHKPQGKGILVKEEFYDGWEAWGITGSKRIKLQTYNAGPSNPGYIYLFLGAKAFDKVEIVFTGSVVQSLLFLIFAVSCLWIIDVTIGFSLMPKVFKKAAGFIRQPFKKWWEKEDEE